MATIIVSFNSEQEAIKAVERLTQAEVGEVRMRVLDSSESLSYDKDESTSPIITPDMGTIEVHPSETPKVPEAIREDSDADVSASIPTTGKGARGVQVIIQVDDEKEDEARKILFQGGVDPDK